MDTYSSHIIQNINDAIIVYDGQGSVKAFNHAAELLFKRKGAQVIGWPMSYVWNNFPLEIFNASDVVLREIECTILDQRKKLSISKTVFKDDNGEDNAILVVRDLTKIKRMEEQIHKKEYLKAIGQLASGMAHEIRNPLNTISTIIQQMERDFEPKKNRSEYYQLAGLMYSEVQCINEKVRTFLNFANSGPLRPQLFRLSYFINLLSQGHQSLLMERQVQLAVDQLWDGEVYWDQEKMRNALMNLIQNSIDVLHPNGRITISVHEMDTHIVEIVVHDNGPGIPAEIRSKIFHLFFTTKSKAKGIGLSTVQQIVYEHEGTIFLDHSEVPGTTFVLQMPKKIRTYKKEPSL